jgi:hypothetical protein
MGPSYGFQTGLCGPPLRGAEGTGPRGPNPDFASITHYLPAGPARGKLGQKAAEPDRPDFKEFAELGEEFAQYICTLNLERETRARVSEYVHEVQRELSKQVSLDPGQLSKWFPKAESAVVEDGARLTITQGMKSTTYSLLEMEPEPYYAVVKEIGAVVAGLLAEADAKREGELKPALQAFARVTGTKLGVFDWRNCELILANTGGRAVGMTVTISAEGRWSYGPIDIDSMETAEIELRSFSKISRSKALGIEVQCEDEDGRRYVGRAELQPASKAVRIFELAPLPVRGNP